MRGFGSDNHTGVHLQILQALTAANRDHAPSYGTDSWTERAVDLFRREFGPSIEVFFVFNGTAANCLALRSCVAPYQSVLCSDIAHLNVDECGAPEYLAGCKLISLPSINGKVPLEAFKQALIRRGDQHFSQPAAISITQPTELGTCYTLEELRSLCQWAHQHGLSVHVDGARLANAVVSLKTSFHEMISASGVDVVSFGGTKNGLAMGEAVVFLKPELAKNFSYIRKQSAQLPSKTRFISAQFEAYLNTNLWKEIAGHALAMAQLLRQHTMNIPGVEITRPTESNAVFAKIPQAWLKLAREKYFFYVWDEKTFECRWMTSWDTTHDDVMGFCDILRQLSQSKGTT